MIIAKQAYVSRVTELQFKDTAEFHCCCNINEAYRDAHVRTERQKTGIVVLEHRCPDCSYLVWTFDEPENSRVVLPPKDTREWQFPDKKEDGGNGELIESNFAIRAARRLGIKVVINEEDEMAVKRNANKENAGSSPAKKTAKKRTGSARRGVGNADVVATFIYDNFTTTNASEDVKRIRTFVTKANKVVEQKPNDKKKTQEKINNTRNRANVGLSRMTLGLILRRLCKINEQASGQSFDKFLTKVKKQ